MTLPAALKHFSYAHLPPHLQAISRPIADIARAMEEQLEGSHERGKGLDRLLEAKDALVRARIEAGPGPEPAGPVEPVVCACARASHEVNRAYCQALGDDSQLPWDLSPRWQQTSAIKGVQSAIDGATPRQSHESWCREKLETGWTWGPDKSATLKTHPCLVAYEELPPEQKARHRLFVHTVREMATALGVKVRITRGGE